MNKLILPFDGSFDSESLRLDELRPSALRILRLEEAKLFKTNE